MTGIIYTSIKSQKKKPKPTAAQRELARAEAEMRAKYEKAPKFGRGKPPAKTPPRKPANSPASPASVPHCPRAGAEVQRAPATYESMLGSTAKKESQFYTGDECMGVALQHKSTYAPVFSRKEAEEITKMRRG